MVLITLILATGIGSFKNYFDIGIHILVDLSFVYFQRFFFLIMLVNQTFKVLTSTHFFIEKPLRFRKSKIVVIFLFTIMMLIGIFIFSLQ